jgi:hypothetical protein
MHLMPTVAVQPNLELKTRPKQLLGSLPLVFELPVDYLFVHFQTSKYSVTLSNRNFHYLMRYLQQDKQPPVLLQILHGKVDLRLADALNACSKVEAVERLRHEGVDGATNDDNNDEQVSML